MKAIKRISPLPQPTLLPQFLNRVLHTLPLPDMSKPETLSSQLSAKVCASSSKPPRHHCHNNLKATPDRTMVCGDNLRTSSFELDKEIISLLFGSQCKALQRTTKGREGLCLQQPEALVKIVPTKERELKLYEAMLYRETFEDEVVHLRNSFSMLEFLEAVLKTGNKMNVGTICGGAKILKFMLCSSSLMLRAQMGRQLNSTLSCMQACPCHKAGEALA
ncbi:hypothetical protein DY000_02011839 [Brassica cretica]|uniref:FH2 domain-containing protein n=1 Tax=Brassica cretica TaxID=69181 RepID=A0ABQ7D661_BRACR|nr:hypothetical protein DY000_02011839 [Brassica cretica]